LRFRSTGQLRFHFLSPRFFCFRDFRERRSAQQFDAPPALWPGANLPTNANELPSGENITE